MTGGPNYGFTGTRHLDEEKWFPRLYNIVKAVVIKNPRLCVTGACVGFDKFMGKSLADALPRSHHLVVVPFNRSRVDVWWEGYDNVFVMQMPPGTTYKDRNKEIVRYGSDQLVAVCEFEEDHLLSKRSGSWQTVRLARTAKVPVSVSVIDVWRKEEAQRAGKWQAGRL